MADHDQIRTGAGNPEVLRQLWERLATELNAHSAGPTKTAGLWQATFSAWKHAVRSRARKLPRNSNEPVPAGVRVLTPLESRALNLWGPEVVRGIGVSAVGVRQSPGHRDTSPPSPTQRYARSTASTPDSRVTLVTPLVTPRLGNPTPRRTNPTPRAVSARRQRITGRTDPMELLQATDDRIVDAIKMLGEKLSDIVVSINRRSDVLEELFRQQQIINYSPVASNTSS